jgi:hypothetical protein
MRRDRVTAEVLACPIRWSRVTRRFAVGRPGGPYPHTAGKHLHLPELP